MIVEFLEQSILNKSWDLLTAVDINGRQFRLSRYKLLKHDIQPNSFYNSYLSTVYIRGVNPVDRLIYESDEDLTYVNPIIPQNCTALKVGETIPHVLHPPEFPLTMEEDKFTLQWNFNQSLNFSSINLNENKQLHNLQLLTSDGKTITTNREILALYSSQIVELILSPKIPDQVQLDYSSDVVNSLLQFLFEGSCQTTKPLKLLLLATSMGVKILQKCISYHLSVRLSETYVIDLLDFAVVENLKDLQAICTQFLNDNISEMNIHISDLQKYPVSVLMLIPVEKNRNFRKMMDHIRNDLPIKVGIAYMKRYALL